MCGWKSDLAPNIQLGQHLGVDDRKRDETAPPDELDLLAFFETEPTLLDPNVPWIYNTATYETERDGYRVRFCISPAYATLKVTLTFEGREIAETELTAFKDLKIQADGDRETLVARFGECTASSLYLTLRPHVRVATIASSDS